MGNANICKVGKAIFEVKISEYLMPYERVLLNGVCKYLSFIYSSKNFNFDVHIRNDLIVFKRTIIKKYFMNKKSYKSNAFCLDLSNQKFCNLSNHERKLILYIIIFQKFYPNMFPLSSFNYFLNESMKFYFSNNIDIKRNIGYIFMNLYIYILF